ncbi:hypothetical protein AURDEDRAFT_173403 [Auricularia subglabra TFB-10046 SS5]|uniref:Uncharacterized protein n=1 Tax=Auricularia subglabra (strain TFB-10046 / SS5) TaxID=717982 RepID=J0WVY8_AURST|nr:hypothetical protein AURDEDRAFT_173403 [Auricularia subglabra TFB-10046 SS5]
MFSLSLPVLALATSALAACPGYRPVREAFNAGIGSQYIMDIKDPNAFDFNTTKIIFAHPCELDKDTLHEMSFVNLDDCSPVTQRYRLVNENCMINTYRPPATGPRILVPVDADGTARLPCYPSVASSYIYDVRFAGYHTDEMMANLGFANRVQN